MTEKIENEKKEEDFISSSNSNDDNKDIETLEEKIKNLQGQLEEKEKEKEADIRNTEKQLRETMIEAIVNSNVNFLKKVVKFVSEFDNRFISVMKEGYINDDIFKSFVSGAIMLKDGLLKDLEEEGLKKMVINPGIDIWNSSNHDFFGKTFDEKLPELTIVEVVENGYVFKDKVVKAAKVLINKK